MTQRPDISDSKEELKTDLSNSNNGLLNDSSKICSKDASEDAVETSSHSIDESSTTYALQKFQTEKPLSDNEIDEAQNVKDNQNLTNWLAVKTGSEKNITYENEGILKRAPSFLFNATILEPNREQYFDIPSKYESYDTNIKAVGIDHGASNCFAAVNRKNQIETVALDNLGERNLPSYIGFDEEKIKCGKIVVDRLGNYPHSAVYSSKKLIGKNLDEILIDPSWSFQLLRDGEDVKIKIKKFNKEFVEKSAEEICSNLFHHMKEKIEEFQGEKVHSVVITIPIAFNKRQKKATIKAAQLAEWKTIYLLPEPIAAAFAYFLKCPIPQNSVMLIFDLGGTTICISILKVSNLQLQIIDSVEIDKVGGNSFDKILYEYFFNELFIKYNINLEKNARKKYQLMSKCQNIKQILTICENAWIDVDDFDTNIDEKIPLTQQEFKDNTSKIIKTIKEHIQKLLYQSRYNYDQIKIVLPVGGGCNMPLIQDLLKDLFQKAEFHLEKIPNELTAIGAAYYAYHLSYVSRRSWHK